MERRPSLLNGMFRHVQLAAAQRRDMDLVNGAAALLDGFGKSPPSPDVAQGRSDVCTGRLTGVPCPHNYQGFWRITEQAGRVLHAQREKKLELSLKTEGEDKLGQCRLCNCPLLLKVWYDWETIYNHTTDETFAKIRLNKPDCWLVTELDAMIKELDKK